MDALRSGLRLVGGLVGVLALGMVLAVVALKTVDWGSSVYAIPEPLPTYSKKQAVRLGGHGPAEIPRVGSQGRGFLVDRLERDLKERPGGPRRDSSGWAGK